MNDERDEPTDDPTDAPGDAMEGDEQRGPLGFLAGVVLGALVGAGVALLLAPARGDVTRRRLGRRMRKMARGARDRMEGWTGDARRELERQRRRMREHRRS